MGTRQDDDMCTNTKLLLLHPYAKDYKDYEKISSFAFQGKIMYMPGALKKSFRYNKMELDEKKEPSTTVLSDQKVRGRESSKTLSKF